MTNNKNVLWKKRATTVLAALVAVGLLLTLAPGASAGNGEEHRGLGELRVLDDRSDRLHDRVVTCDFWVAGIGMPKDEGKLLFLKKDEGVVEKDEWEANDDGNFVNGPYEFEPGDYLVVALAKKDRDGRDNHVEELEALDVEESRDGKWRLAAKPVRFHVDECLTPCPTDLSSTALRDGSILVAFDPAEGSEGSRVYRWVGDADPMLVAELDEGVDEFLDTNTTGGVTYTYMVTGLFEGGRESEGCDTAMATAVEQQPEPEPLACPTGLGATALANEDVRIDFTPAAGSVGSNVYRTEAGGERTLVAELGAGEGSFLDTSTVAGTTYTYEVTAVYDEGESGPCATVQVTAIPVFPTVVGALAASTLGVLAYAGLRRRV